MQEERTDYLEGLTEIDEEGIKEVIPVVEKAEEVVFAGKGRSGYAAKIGQSYLADVGKETSFYNNPSSPRAREFNEKEIVLLSVSGSGETEEVVQAARDYKERGAKTISIIATRNSSLGRYTDKMIKVKRGEEKQEKGSYLGRQVVRPENPTMGDKSEEMSLLTLYLLSKGMQNHMDIENQAKKEIETFKDKLEENKEPYRKIKDSLASYWETGINFVGLGKSETVCKMVANRLHHYGAEVYTIGDSISPPIKPQNLAVLVSGSGSARGLLNSSIEKVKEQEIELVENRPGIVAVVGREGGIEKKGDASLNLGGARSCGRTPTIDKGGGPEPFYFRAPVTFNMMAREIAEEKGITYKLAEGRHINI